MNSEFRNLMSELVIALQVITEKIAPITSHFVHFQSTTTVIANFIPSLEQQSWFISLSIPMDYYPKLAAAAHEGSEVKLTTVIESIYRQEIGNMGAELSTLFPKRASQISPGCDAHARQEYALSVPMFLIAAAGICYDALQTDLFKQGHFRKKLKEILKQRHEKEKWRTEYEIALFGIFDKTIRFARTTSSNDISSHYEVNRHAVLHGTALPEHYGSELNSLKAFSFLATVASVLHFVASDA